MHWSVRLILSEGSYKSTLRNWVMVPDYHGPSWIPEKHLTSYYISVLADTSRFELADFKLEEEQMCKKEDEMYRLWTKPENTSGKSRIESSDPQQGGAPDFLQRTYAEIREPTRLYVNPRKKDFVNAMNPYITKRLRDQTGRDQAGHDQAGHDQAGSAGSTA